MHLKLPLSEVQPAAVNVLLGIFHLAFKTVYSLHSGSKKDLEARFRHVKTNKQKKPRQKVKISSFKVGILSFKLRMCSCCHLCIAVWNGLWTSVQVMLKIYRFLGWKSTPSLSSNRIKIRTVSLSVTVLFSQHFWCIHRYPWYWPDVASWFSINVATSAKFVLFLRLHRLPLFKIRSTVRWLNFIPWECSRRLSISFVVYPSPN